MCKLLLDSAATTAINYDFLILRNIFFTIQKTSDSSNVLNYE